MDEPAPPPLAAPLYVFSHTPRRTSGEGDVAQKQMDGSRTEKAAHGGPEEGTDGGGIEGANDDDMGLDRPASGHGALADRSQRGAKNEHKMRNIPLGISDPFMPPASCNGSLFGHRPIWGL